jgi:hypothetical protein
MGVRPRSSRARCQRVRRADRPTRSAAPGTSVVCELPTRADAHIDARLGRHASAFGKTTLVARRARGAKVLRVVPDRIAHR